MKAFHLAVGQKGERIAASYLKSIGYKILDHNVHIGKRDEVDIIAHDLKDDTLVFVEVKTRSTVDPDFTPLSGMTWKKRQNLSRAIKRYITEQEYDGGYRLDLVCVIGDRVVDHFIEIN